MKCTDDSIQIAAFQLNNLLKIVIPNFKVFDHNRPQIKFDYKLDLFQQVNIIKRISIGKRNYQRLLLEIRLLVAKMKLNSIPFTAEQP